MQIDAHTDVRAALSQLRSELAHQQHRATPVAQQSDQDSEAPLKLVSDVAFDMQRQARELLNHGRTARLKRELRGTTFNIVVQSHPLTISQRLMLFTDRILQRGLHRYIGNV